MTTQRHHRHLLDAYNSLIDVTALPVTALRLSAGLLFPTRPEAYPAIEGSSAVQSLTVDKAVLLDTAAQITAAMA
jgi:hypothetical protein